jgi:hypothetical protein
MIALRPHHLLCVLTYVGKGYSVDFVNNFYVIITRINAGERTLRLIEGPDEICAGNRDGVCGEGRCDSLRRHQADILAADDIESRLGVSARAGQTVEITPELIQKLRESFQKGEIRRACTACVWRDLCTEVADSGFEGAKLTG